ncbi:sulfatase family protein [Georgenia subflava]|uniref:Sulfatase-like hydrolase/transferase n=1 Tax=Georgenia subflava TaxID=1622177 RepID=A0A6N7EID9_9MICO|nr:sulfatase [Georgenia subflava]MPV38152.1 sulfatase-like hydrolase/transferase [Georgenia subflava]
MAGTNLLFVLADQWRAGALGVAGADPVHTPVLDRLAAEGAWFTRAVSNYPVCSPYRAMLMTGQYPHRNGVTSNLSSGAAGLTAPLPTDAVCLSDVLDAAGYDTAYVGKWHLDLPAPADEHHGEGRRDDGRVWDAYTPPGPRRHGFRRWYSHGCSDNHLTPHYWVDEAPREAPHRIHQWSAEHETDVACELLRELGGRAAAGGDPFAVVMSYNPPHPPFDEVPDRYVARYRDVPELLTRPNVDTTTTEGRQAAAVAADYFAAVTGVDEQIGRLLRTLEETGAAGDTLVVFTSDHGMQLGSHGLLAKNVWYDESLLVPLVLRLPGRIEPGRRDALVSTPDLPVTVLSLLGLGDRVPAAMQGRDLADAARSATAPGPGAALYLRMPSTAGPEDIRGLRTPERLLVAARDGTDLRPVHLYDLEADPYQRTDVLAGRPDEARELLAELRAELERVQDPWAVPA